MTYVDWKALKARVSLSDILDHYGLLEALKKTESGWKGACPLHGGEGETFKVTTAKNAWFCHGPCKDGEKDGGNILDFVARKEAVALPKAGKRILEWFPEKKQGKNEGQKEAQKESKAEEVPEAAPREAAEAAGGGAKEGNAKALPKGRSAESEPLKKPNSRGVENKPLEFALKSVEHNHPVLTDGMGFGPATMEYFGVGYFAGKGLMKNRVVIPIHNRRGDLVAYVGYSPKDGSYKYPENFNPALELYNSFQVLEGGSVGEPGVLLTDYFDVFRLFESGIRRAVALPTDQISEEQLALLMEIGTTWNLVVPSDNSHTVDLLSDLIPHLYVRLLRYEGKRLQINDPIIALLRSL